MKKLILFALLISIFVACHKKKTVYCRFYKPNFNSPWVQINCDDNPDNNAAVQNYPDGLYREAEDCDECEKIRQGL